MLLKIVLMSCVGITDTHAQSKRLKQQKGKDVHLNKAPESSRHKQDCKIC